MLNSFSDIIRFLQNPILVQGTVITNADPLCKSRVKVQIPGMTDEIDADYLPWYPICQPGANSSSHIPPMGTRVIIYFIDIYNSIVLGSIASTTSK